MNKKQAMKWVKALRSGNYTQGRAELHNPESDSWCCLGVLTNINKEDTKGEAYLSGTLTKTLSLVSTAGTPKTGRVCIAGKSYHSLSVANDKGVSFKRIATWIEKNYKRL